MAESLSNASGVVALATFAFQSSTILYTAVRDLQSQDKNARALENELADLRGVLQSLLEAVSDNPDMNLEALRFSLYRCGKACEEYGDLIARCTKRSNASRPSMRDWISQQYLRGDISDFREMMAGYRATISIALANANMRIVSIPTDVLGDYKDFISDTTSDLQAHLQRLEEKEQDLAASKGESSFPDAPGWPAMLEEIESTQQCLRICSQLATQIVKLESISKEHPPFSQQPSAYKHLGSGVGAAKSSLYSIGLRLENHEKDIDKRMGAMKSILPLSELESSQLAQLQETKENLRQCLNIVLHARETFTGEQRDRYDGLEQMSTDGAGSSEPDTIFSKSYSDGSTVSSVSALGFTAEEQLVEMLMNHDAFQLLLRRVSKIIKPHEIERHVNHLLHYYGKDLRREAETLAQAAAADFVRRSARRVAIRICASTQNSAHNSIDNSSRGKPLRTELLRRYLESLTPTGTFANGPNADEEINVVEPDGSDDDEPQNLEEVHSFLLSSLAFALLCHSMRVWLKQHEEVPIQTGHEDVPESRNPQYNQSRLRHMSSTLAWIWLQASSFVLQTLRPVMSAAEGARVLWEPRVSTNQERLRWRCSCGKMLYGDFDKMNSQAVRELAKSLKTLSSTKSSGTSVSHSCATPSAMETQVSTPVRLPPSDTGATSNSSRNLSRNLNSRHDGPMDSLTETPIPNLQGQCQPLRRTFFEVCVNFGEYAVRLGEIDITTVRSDAELFSKIWTTYDSMKRNWPKRILLKPRGIHFVYFGVRHRYQAGIYKGPLEIPPMSEVTSERYHYYECPLKVLPPMPAGVFLHYLSCAKRKNWTCEVPEAHAEGFFLQRLPKKIHRSIIDELGTCNTFESSSGIAFGWGVHIIEGPDHGTLSLVLGLGILLSLVISLMVCGIAGTQEQGFGIGQFLLAVLACMMGALYFKLQEL